MRPTRFLGTLAPDVSVRKLSLRTSIRVLVVLGVGVVIGVWSVEGSQESV